MKLPTDIVTRNKIRDSKICQLWGRDGVPMAEIGARFRISGTRVHQIIYKNRHLIKIDKEYEKLKRLAKLKELLVKHPETMSKKSTLDIIDQMREEIDGSKNSDKSVNVTVVMNNVAIEGKPLEYRLGDIIPS
jgi:hypothetical protein